MRNQQTMKLLILILAALAAISAAILHHEISTARQSRQAKLAAELQRAEARIRRDDAEYDEQARFQRKVEELRKTNHAHEVNQPHTSTGINP